MGRREGLPRIGDRLRIEPGHPEHRENRIVGRADKMFCSRPGGFRQEFHRAVSVRCLPHEPDIRAGLGQVHVLDLGHGIEDDPAIFEHVRHIIGQMKAADVERPA